MPEVHLPKIHLSKFNRRISRNRKRRPYESNSFAISCGVRLPGGKKVEYVWTWQGMNRKYVQLHGCLQRVWSISRVPNVNYLSHCIPTRHYVGIFNIFILLVTALSYRTRISSFPFSEIVYTLILFVAFLPFVDWVVLSFTFRIFFHISICRHFVYVSCVHIWCMRLYWSSYTFAI